MKFGFLLPNLIRLLALVLVLVAFAYSQNTGTSPQPGTTSHNPSQSPSQTAQPPTQTAPAVAAGETQTAPPQPGVGNTTPTEAAHSVAWGWLLLGFAIGLLIGALAWRRPAEPVSEDTRRDRVA